MSPVPTVFCAQVCGSFTARSGVQAHIKMHHAHTNIIGLGDSSIWKVPSLPRSIYLFIAPLAVPIITPLAALGETETETEDMRDRRTKTTNKQTNKQTNRILPSETRLFRN